MTSTLEAFFQPIARSLELRHGPAEGLQLFALGFARWAPVFSLAPFLGGRLVPMSIKIALSLLMAWWVLPGLSSQAPAPLEIDSVRWWALLFKEMLIGFVLAFGASLIFWAAEMGGRFIDNVRGTTVANLLLPQVSVQTSLLGDFYFQLFVVLYVVAGGHRWFLGAIFQSYTVLPPLELGLSLRATADGFVVATAGLFTVALKIMAPALVVLMMMDLILGVANRMAPQLDVFFVGLSIKSTLAALIVALSLYYLVGMARGLFDQHHSWLDATLQTVQGRP